MLRVVLTSDLLLLQWLIEALDQFDEIGRWSREGTTEIVRRINSIIRIVGIVVGIV